jgi:hypothetical protein
MTINETTLRELCARVAAGDIDARRDFDRHVSPLVETIVRRWISQQRLKQAAHGTVGGRQRSTAAACTGGLLAKATGAVCARMIARQANRTSARRGEPSRPPAGASTTRETLAHPEQTIDKLAFRPA